MEVSDCVDAALTLALSLDRERDLDMETESKKSKARRMTSHRPLGVTGNS